MLKIMSKGEAEDLVRKYFYTYESLHQKVLSKIKRKHQTFSEWVRNKEREEVSDLDREKEGQS